MRPRKRTGHPRPDGFCDPPIYPEPCCLDKDYDVDGDVDQLDYAVFRAALVGP